MIGLENQKLQSKRLTYRLLEEADKDALREILSDKSVTEPGGFLPAGSAEEFDQFFAALTRYKTGIAILLGDMLIGYIHVNRHISEQPEFRGKTGVMLGFVIGKAYQNHGYATETLETITAYLKQTFDYCAADHFVGNEPSKRVIEKCGYRYLETYTMLFEALGEEKTCLSYIR